MAISYMGRILRHGSGVKYPPSGSTSGGIVGRMMHEVFTDEPSTVTRANVSGKRKRKMMQAIAFSKARKAGATIPYK